MPVREQARSSPRLRRLRAGGLAPPNNGSSPATALRPERQIGGARIALRRNAPGRCQHGPHLAFVRRHAGAAQACRRLVHPPPAQHDPRGELLVATKRSTTSAQNDHVDSGRGRVRGVDQPGARVPHDDDCARFEAADGQPASLWRAGVPRRLRREVHDRRGHGAVEAPVAIAPGGGVRERDSVSVVPRQLERRRGVPVRCSRPAGRGGRAERAAGRKHGRKHEDHKPRRDHNGRTPDAGRRFQPGCAGGNPSS
jgi:hypothetical protein